MTFIKNALLLSVITILCSACSLFSPVQSEAASEYVVNSVPDSVSKKRHGRYTLFVPQPESSPMLNSTAMVYVIKPYQMNYFSKNRWAVPPSQMLQPLIVETLQKTNYFRAVGGAGAVGNYNFILNTQIIEFQQEFFKNSSVMSVRLRAQIIKTSTNQIVASKEFNVVELAPQYSPYGGVIAANRATSKMLSQLAKWCLSQRL
jgi:cholesterol transport system auxiliary component